MAEEDRPFMYEVGVEGDLFHKHRKNTGCASAGCVPCALPPPDDAADAARFRWLVAHSTYAYHCWLLPSLYGDAATIEEALDRAMGEEPAP